MTRSNSTQSRTSRGRWFDKGFTAGDITTTAFLRRRNDTQVVITYGGQATLYLSGKQALNLANNIVDAIEEAHE